MLVVGLGSSGEAAARVLAGLGAHVVIVDSSASPARADAAGGLADAGVEVRLATEVPHDLETFGLVVASPGVPDRAVVLAKAREAGLRVISELELGYRLLEGHEIVAVTGTNGKTTTTSLAAAMLESPTRPAVECGNIGTPIVGLHGTLVGPEVLVCEVSSFQLANIERFRAKVAVILNLAPDHFDWHSDLDDYAAAKARIVENMVPGDFLVYNEADEFCRDVAARAAGTAVGFARSTSDSAGIWLEETHLRTRGSLGDGALLETGDLKIAGAHNLDNVMAASAAALLMGAPRGQVREAAVAFEGLEHRCEPAGSVEGVEFFNDSKATNPHATLVAVSSFEGPFVAILGGKNKGLEFSGLAHTLCRRLRDGSLLGVVVMGECASDIEQELKDACGKDANGHITRATDMHDSVEKAFEMARPRGSVLFSPASASFDMFTDYKDRGRAFKAAVERLAGRG